MVKPWFSAGILWHTITGGFASFAGLTPSKAPGPLMRTRIVIAVAVAAAIFVAGVAAWVVLSREPVLRIAEIIARYDAGKSYGAATIRYPFPEAVFPADIAAPTFRWETPDNQADAWVVRIEFQDGNRPLAFEGPRAFEGPPAPDGRSLEWTPSEEDWSTIKMRSQGTAATATVIGSAGAAGRHPGCRPHHVPHVADESLRRFSIGK